MCVVTGEPIRDLHPDGYRYLVDYYLRASLAGDSNSTYDTHWDLWKRFCQRRRYPEYLYPHDRARSEDCILEFLVEERLLYRNKASTLGVKKASVKSRFDRAGLEDPTSGRRIQLLLKGMRREDGPSPGGKQPVTLRHLSAINEDLQARRIGTKGSALWAAACLCYFFCLRSKNVVAKGKEKQYDPDYILRRGDVRFLAGEGTGEHAVELTPENAPLIKRMVIRIRKSKTDTVGKGYHRAINVNNHPKICAVKAVMAHLLQTPGLPEDAPICAFDRALAEGHQARHVITREDLADAVKAVALRLGEDKDQYASHSFRIGCATAMAAAGFPDTFIMYWGFWKSPAYRGYVRHVMEDPWERELADALIRQDLHPTHGQRLINKWAGLWGD